MRYQPIRTVADLRELERSTEGRSLDFKATADPAQWWELAKDIAAFANHVGGTILVGAAEQGDGTAHFAGVDKPTAAELAREYENAAKDKCKPRPLISIDAIPLAGDKVVIAVNVEPFPLALVGAMFYALDRNQKPQTCDAWRFPVRVGKHNIALQPDQIAMFMEPKTRRMVTLLESIPEADRSNLTLHYVPIHTGHPNSLPIRLVAVDVLQNAFAFVEQETGKEGTHRAPLDDVEAVWEGSPNAWQIKVRGFVLQQGTFVRYVSRPSSSP